MNLPPANTAAILPIASATNTFTMVSEPSPPGLLELGVGQHISASGSYIETETQAAGPMVCRIQRDTLGFSRLVTNRDARILFSGGESAPYDEEDSMMHPHMLVPLDRLVGLVAEEWHGSLRLMVTDAYDSLLDHDLAQEDIQLRYSLHFEGRSIDLILWPPDLSRLGRMCTLAYQAGFDWVHNEGSHCHVSMKADSLCD